MAFVSIKWLINYVDGEFQRVDPERLREVTDSACYRGHQIFVKPGNKVAKTQTCFTWGGCVLLAHPSEETMNAQYRRLEREGGMVCGRGGGGHR